MEHDGAAEPEPGFAPSGEPAGEVYDWFVRGRALLDAGDAAPAVQLLTRCARAEPASRSILETLARAQFQAGQLVAARDNFAHLVEADPADDYAQFGLGLSCRRLGDLRGAVEHLSLAVAMRPDMAHYGRELAYARAAFRTPERREAL